MVTKIYFTTIYFLHILALEVLYASEYQGLQPLQSSLVEFARKVDNEDLSYHQLRSSLKGLLLSITTW